MANKIIEARAVISGEEKLSPLLDKLAKKFDQVEKSAKGGAGVDKMAASMEKLQQQMNAIDKFNASKGIAGVKEAERKLKLAQETAAVTAKAAKDATAGSREAAKAEAEHKRAVASAKAAARAFDQERTAAIAAMRGLDQAGIAAGHVAERQRQIATSVDKATAALERQDRVQRRHASHGGFRQFAGQAAATYIGAHGVASGIGYAVKAGAHLQHERVGLANAGRTPHEMEEIEAASRETIKKVPTSTYTENLKVISETTGAFGSVEHAIENLPFMQKTASVIHAVAGDKIHESAGEMGNKLARFFEMRGTAIHSEKFREEAEEMVRAMVFTRGNFNPAGMVQFGQQSTPGTLSNYSLRFLSKIAPSLATEFKDERAGTAANAFRNVVMGKVNDQKQAEAWRDLGLLNMKQVNMKAGHAVGWRAGAVTGTDLALRDPLEFAEQVLIPAMKAKGINTEDPLAVTKQLGTMFRNSMANRFAEAIVQSNSRQRLHKDEANINAAGKLDDIYQRNLQNDPTVAVTALTASLDNLASVATSPAMKTAASAITRTSEGLHSLANWGADHPNIALGAGLGAAGAGLAGAGWMTYQLMNGFGLAGSAVALDGSAAALTAAAAALGGGKVAGAVAGEAAGAAVPGLVKGGIVATGVLGAVGAGGYEASRYALDIVKSNPNVWGTVTNNPMLSAMSGDYGLAAAIANAGKPSDPLYSATLPWPSAGKNAEPVKAESTGIAQVKGEARITIDIPGFGSRQVNVPLGGILSNGPGSLGTSSPDASAHPVGVGHN